MWLRSLAIVAVLVAESHAQTAAIKVQVTGELVDLEAKAAPVADVVARLAAATGMKVVWEGPRSRQLVTVDLKQRTPVDAVAVVLEGLGIAYGLKMDPARGSVDTLLLYPSAGSGSGGRAERPTASGTEPPAAPDVIDPEGADPALVEMPPPPDENPDILAAPHILTMPVPPDLPSSPAPAAPVFPGASSYPPN